HLLSPGLGAAARLDLQRQAAGYVEAPDAVSRADRLGGAGPEGRVDEVGAAEKLQRAAAADRRVARGAARLDHLAVGRADDRADGDAASEDDLAVVIVEARAGRGTAGFADLRPAGAHGVAARGASTSRCA